MIKKFTLLFLFSLSVFLTSASNPQEMRAVWLTTNYMLDWPSVSGTSENVVQKQKAEMIRILDELRDAGINTVLFQTRVRGGVFYHSEYEGFSYFLTGKPNMSNNAFDPLAFVVDECHRRSIKCHAWIVCMPLGSEKYLQRQGIGDFVTRNKSFVTRHNGEYYLEPSSPETARYLSSMAVEIVSNYAVDGIHLDYIRYPEHASSYPDSKYYAASGKKTPLSQWRRDNITRIVYEIYDRVKTVSPEVMVSSATLGLYDGKAGVKYYGWNAYDAGYQDVERWLEENKHDFITPMMYYKDPVFYPFVIDWCQRRHGKQIVPGIGIYRLNEPQSDWLVSEIEKQIFWTRNTDASGYALFRTGNLLENPGLLWRLQYLNQ
ncbi:MAG: glycoside hydrolase family 10 protein [Bacteroidales bacterium]